MLVPLSWLLEYAAAARAGRPGEVARRLTADRARGRVRRAGRARHLRRRGRAGAGDRGAHRLQEADQVLPGRRAAARTPTSGRSSAARRTSRSATWCRSRCLAPCCPAGSRSAPARRYGRLSDGMICSAAELAIGDDHSGIMVLPPDAPLGADFVGYAGLRDVVLDVNVTPDKGHALSIRGMARELASAFGGRRTPTRPRRAARLA